MEIIWDKVFDALTYIFVAGIVSFVWKQAHDRAGGGRFRIILWKGLQVCGGVALFASLVLGQPSCEVQSDPVYGGCDQYADDGFQPTTAQRAASFSFYFVLLYVPFVIGAHYGKNGPKVESNG